MPLRLVIAYDGSATAGTAVDAAAALFPGADAVVATVGQPIVAGAASVTLAVPTVAPEVLQRTIDELETEAREAAEQLARQGAQRASARGLTAEPRAVVSNAAIWAALCEVAHEVGADVLVCGTRGRSAFTRALLGSTATALLHHGDLPLLIVPDGAGALDGPAVIAYDGSEPSRRAIDVGGRLLGGRRALVVHVWESQYRHSRAVRALAHAPVSDLREIVGALDEALEAAAEERVREGVERARAAGLNADGEALESDTGVWRTLAAAASRRDAAVIVTGARGIGGARSALLGSVSSGLIHNAAAPVLVVPPARRDQMQAAPDGEQQAGGAG